MPALPPPITSRTNARVKALRASLSGEARRPGDLLGLEGAHLIAEAHAAGQSFETVFVRQGDEAILHGAARWDETLRTGDWAVLSRDVFDSAVTTAAPQGIAATWRIRQPDVPSAVTSDMPNALVLENLQDPGNLGTLIRSALAFGFDRVFATPDSANHWNPKTVRSAAGTIFRVPVERKPLPEIMASLQQNGLRTFAAVAGFTGDEGAGHGIHSAPHGVLFGHRHNFEAQSPRYSVGEITDAREREWAAGESFPASLSCDADFQYPCALLIGNEGAGLSREARLLADEQVQIPCNAESLNAAVAGSILMYEAMRQLSLRAWAVKQGLRP